MSFFSLVRREMQGSLTRMVIMSGTGGVSNAAILYSINSGAQAAADGKSSVAWAALFVVSLFLFIKSQHYLLISMTVEIESIIHKVRIRIMDDLRRSELLPLEAIGRARIVAAITRDTTTMAQAANMLAFGAQSLVLLVLIAIYVAYLSIAAILLSFAIVGAAVLLFHLKSGELERGTREAAEWQNRLFDRLIDMLDGFKEVRLNRLRSDELFSDAVEVSRTAGNIKIKTDAESFKRLVLAQSSMQMLLGAVVFIVPVISSSAGKSVTQAMTALLFVVGSAFGLVSSIPIIGAANAAADNIEQLEVALRATATAAELGDVEPPRRFEHIEMRDIVFRYVDKASEDIFQVGPVNFSLRSGETVFITGGNGSGKSTFLRVLAGLYKPDSGEMTFDGVRVTDATIDRYRSLISSVFTDYHMFHRLYGIHDPDSAEVARLLSQFRLDTKTGLVDGAWRTIDLSGGQRKRLALIVSLLEGRPILLLDEWTADQDPEFRRKFYFELLPALQNAGETVVLITHDDRYLEELDMPARRLRMDVGRFVD
jgi:putative ATP-binding cassette transporter